MDGVWKVAASRKQMKREHRVPLCGRALERFAEARTLDDRAAAASTGPEGRDRARGGSDGWVGGVSRGPESGHRDLIRTRESAQEPISGRCGGISGILRAAGSPERDDRRSPRGYG